MGSEMCIRDRHTGIGIGAYNLDGRSFSAADVAQLRAKKMLLGEQLEERRSSGYDPLSIIGLRGLTCVVSQVFSGRTRPTAELLRLARLAAIGALVEHGVVKHVLDLSLRHRKNVVNVKFRGQCPTHYHGETPEVIEFEGDC